MKKKILIIVGIVVGLVGVGLFISTYPNIEPTRMLLGIALLLGGIFCVGFAVKLPSKTTTGNPKPPTENPKSPIVIETPSGYDYEAHNKRRLEYKSTETTIRTPIELDDPDINKKTAEHKEYMKAFLESVVYPKGFVEYINDTEFNRTNKYIIKDRCDFGEFFEVYDILKLEEIKEITLEILIGDDYHTQFRDLVMFASDDGGHGKFFLDYGQNKSNPSVKFLDNEIDIVEHVADNFDEFLANLVDEENPVLKEFFEEIDDFVEKALNK